MECVVYLCVGRIDGFAILVVRGATIDHDCRVQLATYYVQSTNDRAEHESSEIPDLHRTIMRVSVHGCAHGRAGLNVCRKPHHVHPSLLSQKTWGRTGVTRAQTGLVAQSSQYIMPAQVQINLQTRTPI